MADSPKKLTDIAFERLVKGEITQQEYDDLLRRIAALHPPSALPPAYVPSEGDRNGPTVGGDPVQPGPGTRLMDYRLDDPIGRGGMGQVWKAWDSAGGRPVAVKLLPPEFRGNSLAVAQVREAFAIIHDLAHQHIGKTIGLFEDPVWGPYIVLELLPGVPLSQWAKAYRQRRGRLPRELVARLLAPVAMALDYGHAKGVLHRDVKPDNILVEAPGDDSEDNPGDEPGDIWLIDYGLAAEIRATSVTHTNATIDTRGTRPFMAPEQFAGKRHLWDGRTDQYALAVVAYQLLAGHLPFDADDEFALMLAIRDEAPSPISHLESEVNAVLLKALAKQKEQRFANCTTFIQTLAKFPRRIMAAPPEIREMPVSAVIPVPVLLKPRRTHPSPLKSPFTTDEAEAGQKAWGAYLGRQVYEKNSLGMELALIPPGSFLMGSPKNEKERSDNEGPVTVTMTRSFWLGRTPVTRKQWTAVMGSEPWQGLHLLHRINGFLGYTGKSDQQPATFVRWNDAMEYCSRLTERDGGDWEYRLPTEAEWEWACRAGTLTSFWFGETFNGSQFNCDGSYRPRTNPNGPYERGKRGTTAVGGYAANPFGLWDMHGNVWEWCADWYGEKLPGGENPEFTTRGSSRVNRGGSWGGAAVYCRSAYRRWDTPDFRNNGLGFRVLAVPSSQ